MSGNFISFRGGTIKLGGNVIQSPMPVILLAHGYERNYFIKPFNPDVMDTPDCYSFDNVQPHEKSPVPQSDLCTSCRMNQFGSASNQKGKACKEGARLAFIHADHAQSAEQIAAAPVMQARLSVLNSKGFRSYVENVFDAENRPTWMSISELTCVPDSHSQYAVSFAPVVLDADDNILDAIAGRVPEAEKLLVTPYVEIAEAPQPAPQAGTRRRKF